MITEIHIGILFHAMVTAIIAVIAAAFVIFLIRRWTLLDRARRAYVGFWVVTALVWSAITVRYFMIGAGLWGAEINVIDLFIQIMVFCTGPPLYYYAGLRIFSDKRVAVALVVVSLIFIFVGVLFLFGEHGLVRVAVTNFSTETNLNPVSYGIFIMNALALIALIAYDFILRMRQWVVHRDSALLYDALYSAAILIYVGLGSIDNSKIFLEWGLVILRIFYSAAFLFAYSVVVEHQFSRELFLTEDEPHKQHAS